MRMSQTRYVPVSYSSSGGGSRVNVYANWTSLNIDYPTGRRPKPKSAIEGFRKGTWLTVTGARYVSGVSTISSGNTWAEYETASLMVGINHLPGDIETARTIATNKARASMKGEGVNLALMVAEMDQTNDLIRNILGELSSMRKLRTKSGRKLSLLDLKIRLRDGGLSEGASNKILAYNYGLAPLLGDLRTSTTLAAKRADNHPLVRMGRETYKNVVSKSGTTANGGSYSLRTTTSAKVISLCAINPSPVVNALSSLRLTNPLELAYERIPFSFVLDWAMNAGEVISSLDNPLTMGGSFETMVTYRIDQNLKASYKGGTHEYDSWTMSRDIPGNTSTIAQLVYEPSLSARRLLNAVALTRQRLPQSLFTPRSK